MAVRGTRPLGRAPSSTSPSMWGSCSPLAEHALDVLRDDIDLDVDGLGLAQRRERRPLRGVRDDRDLERLRGDRRDGEADAVDRDEALLDDVAAESLRHGEAQACPLTLDCA